MFCKPFKNLLICDERYFRIIVCSGRYNASLSKNRQFRLMPIRLRTLFEFYFYFSELNNPAIN